MTARRWWSFSSLVLGGLVAVAGCSADALVLLDVDLHEVPQANLVVLSAPGAGTVRITLDAGKMGQVIHVGYYMPGMSGSVTIQAQAKMDGCTVGEGTIPSTAKAGETTGAVTLPVHSNG